jgi:hypothetical protein
MFTVLGKFCANAGIRALPPAANQAIIISWRGMMCFKLVSLARLSARSSELKQIISKQAAILVN